MLMRIIDIDLASVNIIDKFVDIVMGLVCSLQLISLDRKRLYHLFHLYYTLCLRKNYCQRKDQLQGFLFLRDICPVLLG